MKLAGIVLSLLLLARSAYCGTTPEMVNPAAPDELPALYPPPGAVAASPGDTTYFVDPAKGDDSQAGTAADKPWKSIARVNALILAPGDKVTIAPGLHEATLKPSGAGTAEKPIVIEFLPGVHEFAVATALRRPWFISNSCDAPTVPKPVGILVENMQHVHLLGGGVEGEKKTEILLGGRMIEFINSHATDITYSGLVFDLKRPTVSEFRVLEVAENSVDIRVAEGSTYEIKNGKFGWTGDIGSGGVMVQEAIPETGQCWRVGVNGEPFASAAAQELEAGKVRLTFAKGNRGMKPGHQFQFRHIFRDSAGAHNTRCKDIVLRDCDFYALTNMGIVSQFTENITYQRVRVAPPPGTIRTCPAWADAFHFSGCKGDILVESCRFSGLQDDPINVHGTHLRIIEKLGENQFHLRFMQPQTYGFAAFMPGDEVAVISHSNLRELPDNPHRKVTAVEPLPGDKSGKDWLLTLDGPAPTFGKDDVVDNLSWYPNFTARNNHVTMDSCRGFLITTRGKVVVEGNTFQRCAMAGILIEDDAEGWFESGPIRAMLIGHNTFIGCGISINPQTHSHDPAEPVHENIRIADNTFNDCGIDARSTRGLTITGNHFSRKALPVHTSACTAVTTADNQLGD